VHAVVFWFHGINSHSRHDDHTRVASAFSKRGFHVFCFDQAGFGRSAVGDDRGWIADWRWWVDDAVSFILQVMEMEKYEKYPFFIAGVSLGGAVALRTGMAIQRIKKLVGASPVWERWLGIVLFCPAIAQSLDPSWIEVATLETIHAMGGDKLPLGPEPVMTTFPTRESYDKFMNDPFCVQGKMKLGLAFQGREMLTRIQAELHEVAFPFVIFHGTDDEVTPYEASKRLMNESVTPAEDKTMHTIEGGTHYILLADEREYQMMSHAAEWMLGRRVAWEK